MNEPGRPTSGKCPICGSGETWTFLEMEHMPAQDGVVYPSEQEALDAPCGDIDLSICRRCHYIWNVSYDPSCIQFADYSYSQHHSTTYKEYLSSLIASLIQHYDLKDKTLIDIGCGEGYFLSELCRLGDNRGIGIDPSNRLSDEIPIDKEKLSFIHDCYSDEHTAIQGDFFFCRHVIDELDSPKEFVKLITHSLSRKNGSIIYIELPNAMRTFEENLIWNIGYAKKSWFSSSSITTLLRLCGLDVLDVEPVFGNEYLGITGRIATGVEKDAPFPEGPNEEILKLLETFAEHATQEFGMWESKVQELKSSGGQMIVWGAGMRGINFLNRFGDPDIFPRVVDVNPDRQGKYLPDSGYLVDSPGLLKEVRTETVLISNPIYAHEIETQLTDMRIDCQIEIL